MLILENIKMAISSLRANKMRALLTMLGIIIGIGSVIAIMTVSSSLTGSISNSFQEMGANNITVGLTQSSEEEETTAEGKRFGTSNRNVVMDEEDRITDEMISALKTEFPKEIDGIALSETVGSCTTKKNQDSATINVTGINQDYFLSSNITLLAGRKIKQRDLKGNKRVIMVTDYVVEKLFEGDNNKALSQKISVDINGIYLDFYIVGVFEYESNSTISDSSEDVITQAYIPLNTAKEIMRSDDGYANFTVVTATSVTSVSTFAKEIESFFDQYYRSNEEYEITTSTMESLTESLTDMVEKVSIAIAFIAGISLLVGGIGVMNIMLVSVTERTREIGTRKALGAKNSSIRLQFIIESIILCLIGGIIGIILGLILGSIAASALGCSATAPIGAILLSVGFSMVIGMFFGYYPANKAAKLNPIEALRYE